MCYTIVWRLPLFSGDLCKGSEKMKNEELNYTRNAIFLMKHCHWGIVENDKKASLFWFNYARWVVIWQDSTNGAKANHVIHHLMRGKLEGREERKKEIEKEQGRTGKRSGLSVKWTSRRGDVPLALMLLFSSASSDLADRHFRTSSSLHWDRRHLWPSSFPNCITEVTLIFGRENNSKLKPESSKKFSPFDE